VEDEFVAAALGLMLEAEKAGGQQVLEVEHAAGTDMLVHGYLLEAADEVGRPREAVLEDAVALGAGLEVGLDGLLAELACVISRAEFLKLVGQV
jgi:hypothetical protein